jgi:hypothetical protein
MADALPKIQGPAFSASTTKAGEGLVLALQGNADTEVMTELTGYLDAVHAAAQTLKIAEVVVDSRELYFMTSSCFKCFLTWITAIEQLEERKRYTIRLEANAKLHWQRRSFDALRAFSQTIVTVNS